MPNPFFADLVREFAQEGGTGPLTPTGAVPGHRRFADAVPADTLFHYAVAGIGQPGQWETGLGHLDGGGRLVRDTVAASSAGGAPVDFTAGLKTIALTVGAGWFASSAAAQAALDASVTTLAGHIEAKQPLSTTHAQAATGAAGDLITVARGSGWVNVPLATLPFQNGAGRHEFAGTLSAPGGSAAAPAISFTGDLDTGLFCPGANMLAFAAGGAERVRITSAGDLGIGTNAPARTLHISRSDQSDARIRISNLASGGESWELCAGVHNAAQGAFSLYNVSADVICWVANGTYFRPGYDNYSSSGTASARWSVVFSASGAINTSDARDKLWLGGANLAELAAARRIIRELGFYQWTDAIAAKGMTGARRHFGVRAQAVWDIMAEEGLCDPSSDAPGYQPYAFLCYDAWRDEESGETRSRYGIRPDQLALFLIAAQEARLAALEAAA